MSHEPKIGQARQFASDKRTFTAENLLEVRNNQNCSVKFQVLIISLLQASLA